MRDDQIGADLLSPGRRKLLGGATAAAPRRRLDDPALTILLRADPGERRVQPICPNTGPTIRPETGT